MIPPSIWPWKYEDDATNANTQAQATPAEWLEFFASLATSLAWPIIVLILFFTLRQPLTLLLTALRDRVPNMTSVEALGVKVNWSERAVQQAVEGVRHVSQHTRISSTRSSEAVQKRREKALQLAKVEPSAGVIHAFIGIELALADIFSRGGEARPTSPIAQLRKSDLPRDLQESIRQFAQLRNAAAHGHSEIEFESAREYIDGAAELEASLRNW